MNLTDARFQNADKAREWLEMQRWPTGPYCTHCGSFSVTGLSGRAHRPGVYQCNDCRQQFTVTTGSVMERSKIPLNKWLMAMHLMASSKKGYSAHQLHRTLGITYQSAWFLAHRIREAMANDKSGPLGGEGKTVEVDETYFGKVDVPRKKTTRGRPFTKSGRTGPSNKRAVVSLVERGGKSRTFHFDHATAANIRDVIVRNVSRKSKLHTDAKRALYRGRQRVRFTRDGEALCQGIRSRRRAYEHRGRLFLDLQARHERRLSALWRGSFASLRCRVRFPLQQSLWPWRRGYRARC